MSTRKDFERLLRKTTGGSSDAPWWVRVLLNSVVALVVLGMGAIAYDGLIAPRLGREPIAWCSLLNLFPYGLFEPAGLFCLTIGGIALIIGAKEIAIRWLVIGLTCFIVPDLYLSLGPVRACGS